MLFTACSKNKEVLKDNENIQPVQDNTAYELTAVKSDKQGIDNSTAFKLTSKKDIDTTFIKNNLKIIPEKEFKVEEISSTMCNIIPLSVLENDKIYQVKIDSNDYVYSWAFQTKKKLQVESTIPADKSVDVPWSSGIELYFTLGNVGKIDDYFEISPKVEGKFIANNNSIVFVPEQLERSTIYTVTIKKGLKLEDGSGMLEEDYVFSFSTQKEINTQIYFERPIINIHESNAKIVDAYIETEKEFNINIYQYKDSDKFAQDVFNFAETGKFPKEIDNNKLTLINSITQKPFMQDISYYQNALFELPDELTKGYYLAEFSAVDSEFKQYLFVQINDILIYNALFDNQFVVLACDGDSSKEIQDAEIILNGKTLGYTDESGVLVKNEKISELKSINLKVRKEGYNDFIYAESLFNNYYYFNYLNGPYNYLVYMDTDRPVYLPDDTVNVWGFARYRDKKSLNKVKIDLVELNTELVLETKYADLTDIGTYDTQFELKNITSEGLKINVYDNDIFVSSSYISIREYTKPLYKLDGTLDKEFVYSGESINYKVNANFFDGNPVPDLKLNFKSFAISYRDNEIYDGMDQVISLNENGEYIIKLNTQVKSSSWRPVSIAVDSYTNEAEDVPVALNDVFNVFPKDKMLEVEQDENKPQLLNILFHELNIDGYNTNNNEDDYYYDFYYDRLKHLRGNPLDAAISVRIVESYFEKIKVGEQYDFINKVNEIKYDYNRVSNTVYNDYVSTVSGLATLEIPNYNEERSYEITAYYEDNNGGIKEESYVYGKRYSYSSEYYQLEKLDNKKNFRLNESVNLQLLYEEKNVSDIDNDNLFVMFMKDNLIEYQVTDSTNLQTVFKEDFIPNVFLYGVYVKNGYTYPVAQNDGLYYDRTERQLYLDVTTNKEEYLPGEEVTINVKTYDENNKPLVSDVNFSVVDESYFAIFNKDVSTLEDLYMYSWTGGLKRSYLSNIDLSEIRVEAERGGGGGEDGAFRDDFKDTNFFKTITTDKKGNGNLKFKLADNLTSWRITYQGITDSLYAGSGTKNITVSLPFFVDLIMNKEYLKEDKINVSLRVFGTNAKESDQVDYKVTVKDKDSGKKVDYTATGSAGDYTNINLNKLDEGQYEVYVTAKSNNNEDNIKEEFSVVDSFIYFNNTDYYKLSENTVLEEVYSNPVITLFNESKSDFYNSLSNMSSSYGKRIDQTVCSMLATKYINDYFDTDLYFNEEEMLNEINKYESKEGGFKLFTYSEPSAEITAKLVYLIDNDYLEEKIKVHFKNTLKNEEYNTDIAAALWGISKSKEPVLLTIYDLLENENLEVRDKIYLSLALAELGDNSTATKYYKEITAELNKSGDYLNFTNGADEQDNYELTALLAVLGVKLQDYVQSDKLFKYIFNQPSKYALSNFEQLIYIMNRDIMKLEEIKDLFGEVTINVDGNKKTYKLKLFDRESFAVTKEKIMDIKFSNINGSIACKVEALGNKEDLDKNKTEDFTISIDYMKKDTSEKQTSFNYSDVVKVTVKPSFSSKVESGAFEITYIIPSGFRYIDSEINPSWLDVNGQKITYDCYYDKKYPQTEPMVFYLQAAQKGEYTVDYAVIKEYFENKLNYIEKTKLTVN
jgi:hypothetical protein